MLAWTLPGRAQRAADARDAFFTIWADICQQSSKGMGEGAGREGGGKQIKSKVEKREAREADKEGEKRVREGVSVMCVFVCV